MLCLLDIDLERCCGKNARQWSAMAAHLFWALLESEGFAEALDRVLAEGGCMVAPAAADKVEHIRDFLITQTPPEIRHGDSGRRSLR